MRYSECVDSSVMLFVCMFSAPLISMIIEKFVMCEPKNHFSIGWRVRTKTNKSVRFVNFNGKRTENGFTSLINYSFSFGRRDTIKAMLFKSCVCAHRKPISSNSIKRVARQWHDIEACEIEHQRPINRIFFSYIYGCYFEAILCRLIK